MAKRMNLKEHLNDDNLDLSLCDLQEVPVKDIAAFPKATSLDLSSNKLVTLHKSFSISLTHLVKLDLARNQIKELPQNFGLLINLKHLDLYKNCLETLPLSFGNLTALRWLDLKANPLETHWEQIVGPCFSKKDCADAAKNVVRLSRMMNNEIEVELQRAQARQKKDEEAELKDQNRKKEKQKEKKKRRNAAKLAEMNKETVENGKLPELEPSLVRNEGSDATCDQRSPRRGYRVIGFVTGLLKLMLTLTAVLLLSVLVLSLVNPPVYRRLLGQVSNYTGPIAPKIPGHLRVTWHKATTNLMTFSKYAIANIYSLSRQGVRILNNIYIFVTTDPQFEVYLHLIIKYLLLVYIKICEIVDFSFYHINFLWSFSTEAYQQYVSPFLK